MTVHEHSAFPIVKTILDGTGRALLRKCFLSFAQYFTVPHVIETFEGSRTVASFAEFRGLFDGLVTQYERRGVTDLVRNCLEVKFRDENTILCAHEVRIMSGSQLLWRPYPVFSEVKRIGQHWKVVRTSYAIEGNPALADVLSGKAELD